MRLFIAEKPSLGRAIAEALTDKPEKQENCLVCGNDDIVAWSAGHILRLKEPKEYNPEYKNWNKVSYPLIPETMEYVKSENAYGLLDTIEKLLKKADVVVNAGDADREGQLLIDEILDYFGYSGAAKRILITDLTKEGIKKALDKMTDNKEHKSLSDAGKARMLADWLLGLNMTMLYTVTAQKNGYSGTPISIGRVQTPVLGLIVERDYVIENFKSKIFYALKMNFLNGASEQFTATWKARENQEGLDEEDRLVDTAVKDALKKSLDEAVTRGEKGLVVNLTKKSKKKHPPLTHSLPSLQIEASEKYGISPADTLKHVQDLYEAGILSYPRSDCQYLPESTHGEAGEINQAIAELCPALKSAAASADISRKSAAFDDKKIAEHYAIIPTGKKGSMSEIQAKIFALSATRFIVQFYPDYEFLETKGEISFNGEIFTFAGNETKKNGWRDVMADPEEKENDGKESGDAEEEKKKKLPAIKKDEELQAVNATETEKKTTPPKRFTEATILKAMNNIHKYVNAEEIKKILKETDGIGTAATQAETIVKLFERLYISKKGKDLISTDKGRHLIKILPDSLKTPDKTAFWEREMKRITGHERDFAEFMSEVAGEVSELVEDAHKRAETIKFASETQEKAPDDSLDSLSPCYKCGSPMRLLNGKNGKFWLCSNATCKATCDDLNGKPKKPQVCPRCKTKIVKRDGKNGAFWPCNSCGLILDDVKGKPQKTKKCPKCGKGYLRYIETKDGKTHFWRCSDCDNKEYEK
jgi:DNA topoisomerase-3